MLNNNTPETPLPRDLQSRVENALNQVSVLEAECHRLGKLETTYKQNINALHEELKVTEFTIKSLKEQAPDLNHEINRLNTIINGLNSAVKDSNDLLLQVEGEIKEKISSLNSLNAEIKNKEKEIQAISKLREVNSEKIKILELDLEFCKNNENGIIL